MRLFCVIATYGSDDWRQLAWTRAYPSTIGQGFDAVQVVHEPQGTLAQARNTGAVELLRTGSEGDYVVFLDADDELAPGYADAMRAALDPDRDALLVPAVQYVFDTSGTRSEPAIPQVGRWPELNECVIGTGVPLAAVVRLGGFREWLSLEDYDLWLRCYDDGARLHYVPDAVYRAHVRERSRNADQSSYESIWAEHLARIGN